MSADNYYLIRKHEGKFVVTCEFASDEGPGSVTCKSAHRFDTFAEAFKYGSGEYSEYGVRVADDAMPESPNPSLPKVQAANDAEGMTLEQAVKNHRGALIRMRSHASAEIALQIGDAKAMCDYMEDSMKEAHETEDAMFAALDRIPSPPAATPLSADGVRIARGMTVWACDDEGNAEAMPVEGVHEGYIEWHDRQFRGAHMTRKIVASVCYSTRDAALASFVTDKATPASFENSAAVPFKAGEATNDLEVFETVLRRATTKLHKARCPDTANCLEDAAKPIIARLSAPPVEPVAWMTKAGLCKWLKGSDVEEHILLRTGNDMRVPIYAAPLAATPEAPKPDGGAK